MGVQSGITPNGQSSLINQFDRHVVNDWESCNLRIKRQGGVTSVALKLSSGWHL